MKKLFITLLTIGISVLPVIGQNFSEVVVDSTKSKSQLYSNALTFFAEYFKSANNVIQMKDPETGKVIGKGLIGDGEEIKITITCKDGKYKYDIECFYWIDDISFPITEWIPKGQYGHCTGKTMVDTKQSKDGSGSIFNKDDIYFKYDSEVWSYYTYVYNSDSRLHRPAPMNKPYYLQWKSKVDKLLTNNPKYKDLGNGQYQLKFNVEDIRFVLLKAELKTIMKSVVDDF